MPLQTSQRPLSKAGPYTYLNCFQDPRMYMPCTAACSPRAGMLSFMPTSYNNNLTLLHGPAVTKKEAWTRRRSQEKQLLPPISCLPGGSLPWHQAGPLCSTLVPGRPACKTPPSGQHLRNNSSSRDSRNRDEVLCSKQQMTQSCGKLEGPDESRRQMCGHMQHFRDGDGPVFDQSKR